jgi:exodeoxyribonuclease-3
MRNLLEKIENIMYLKNLKILNLSDNFIEDIEPLEKLEKLQKSLNFIDTHRFLAGEDLKLYSWWSYRAKDPLQSDRGRRLDHIWITPDLKSSLKDAKIYRDFRLEKMPSDHVPIEISISK